VSSLSSHYAFLVTEAEFDAIYGARRAPPHALGRTRIKETVNDINHHDGGRGRLLVRSGGHFLEAITVPYGGWPAE